jgi:hypothetical protein
VVVIGQDQWILIRKHGHVAQVPTHVDCLKGIVMKIMDALAISYVVQIIASIPLIRKLIAAMTLQKVRIFISGQAQ